MKAENWFQLRTVGVTGPEITKRLGAFLCAARFKAGFALTLHSAFWNRNLARYAEVDPHASLLVVTDAHRSWSRAVSWTCMALTSGIALGWAVLLSLYIRGRLVWGHWPRFSADDPKDVGEGLHYTLAGYSTATMAICTLAVFVILSGLGTIEQKGCRTAKATAFAVAMTSVLMVVFGPWVSWYLD